MKEKTPEEKVREFIGRNFEEWYYGTETNDYHLGVCEGAQEALRLLRVRHERTDGN